MQLFFLLRIPYSYKSLSLITYLSRDHFLVLIPPFASLSPPLPSLPLQMVRQVVCPAAVLAFAAWRVRQRQSDWMSVSGGVLEGGGGRGGEGKGVVRAATRRVAYTCTQLLTAAYIDGLVVCGHVL